MKYSPIKTGRLSDEVCNQIKESIFQSEYQPGDKIPSEQELVSLFGVSRIIVREAIRELEVGGFVHIKRGPLGGAFVKKLTHNPVALRVKDYFRSARGTVKEIMDVRLEIEPIVAGLAADRATQKDLNMLKYNLDTLPDCSGEELVKSNINFHRLLAKCSHNPIYDLTVNILLDISKDLIIDILSPGEILHDTTSHPELYALIANGDTKKAFEKMRIHIEDVIPLMQAAEAKQKNKNFKIQPHLS